MTDPYPTLPYPTRELNEFYKYPDQKEPEDSCTRSIEEGGCEGSRRERGKSHIGCSFESSQKESISDITRLDLI